MVKSIFFFSLLFMNPTYAQEFTFEHSDCVLRYQSYTGEREELRKQANGLLKERKYVTKQMLDNKRLLAGELYFSLDIERPKKKVYTSCVVKVSIKKAKGAIPSDRDQVIYAKSIDRRVPRITLAGKERCKLALKDAFVHIPTCRKIGFAGEKK